MSITQNQVVSLKEMEQTKKDSTKCCGSSQLFLYNRGMKSNELERVEIKERVKHCSLDISNDQVLLLENFKFGTGVQGSSGYLVAYLTEKSKVWSESWCCSFPEPSIYSYIKG